MRDSKRYTMLVMLCLGLGIVLVIGIGIGKMNQASPENHVQPETGGVDERSVREVEEASSGGSVQPPGEPEQDPAPAPRDTARPPRAAAPAIATPGTVEDLGTPPGEDEIYTMDTLPRDRYGIYWVRDPDGNVVQIAVDVPGEGSPIGVVDPGR